MLSGALNRRGIRHNVLNAKQHEREAEIVAQAGRIGSVTVATNMAGRGTDIVLGGNADGLLKAEMAKRKWEEESHADEIAARRAELEEQCLSERNEVLENGGLYVLGTERHEARRIDNQLRGRAGRQGDPGRTRFFLSLDDALMKRFYRDWVKNFLGRAGMGGGEPVESKMVSNAIRKAQKKVEAYHFEIRKNLLEYDEVMDKQRHLIYEHRQEALEAVDLRGKIHEMFAETISNTVNTYRGDGRDVPTDWEAISLWAQRKWDSQLSAEALESVGLDDIETKLNDEVAELYAGRVEQFGDELMGELERFLMLNAIDTKWKEHLYTMDSLRAGISLRGYAQVDPKSEYKREGLERFQELLYTVADEVTGYVLRMKLAAEDENKLEETYQGAQASHPQMAPASATGGPASQTGGPGGMRQRPRQRVAVGYQAPKSTAAGQREMWQKAQAATEAQEAAEREAKEAQAKQSTTPAAPPAEPEDPYAKVGRNEPCPCGSGKKFKQCHGKA